MHAPKQTTILSRRLVSLLGLAALTVFALTNVACDRADGAGAEKAESQQPSSSATDKPGTQGDHEHDDHDEHGDHEEDEAHGHHDVHLGSKMYELGRRFAAVWYAGKAANGPMLDYQIHEIEEVIAEIEEAAPTENGVDVAEKLDTDIAAPLEKLEKSLDSDDIAFEKTYRSIMTSCSDCHAMTNHDFINVTIPEYNPYPNLSMEPQK